MDPRFKRNLKIITVIHVGVILGLMVSQWVRDLVRRKKPQEVVTYVSLSELMPEPAPVVDVPPPEPKAPEPPPEPPPEVIPEKPPPKQVEVEVSKKKVRRDEVRPEPVRKPKKLTEQQLRDMLASAAPTPRTDQDDFPFDWYYALVRRAFFEAWDRPSTSTVPPGTLATVSIRVLRDGTIGEYRVIRASGNGVMDDSVLRAMKAVKKIKPLPSQYRGEYKEITVDFQLAGSDY